MYACMIGEYYKENHAICCQLLARLMISESLLYQGDKMGQGIGSAVGVDAWIMNVLEVFGHQG